MIDVFPTVWFLAHLDSANNRRNHSILFGDTELVKKKYIRNEVKNCDFSYKGVESFSFTTPLNVLNDS